MCLLMFVTTYMQLLKWLSTTTPHNLPCLQVAPYPSEQMAIMFPDRLGNSQLANSNANQTLETMSVYLLTIGKSFCNLVSPVNLILTLTSH